MSKTTQLSNFKLNLDGLEDDERQVIENLDLDKESLAVLEKWKKNQVTKTAALKKRTRTKKRSDYEKEIDNVSDTITSMVKTICSKPTTSLPEPVREHFLVHLRESIPDSNLPDHFDVDVVDEIVDSAVKSSDEKRPRHQEQDKLVLVKKEASKIVHGRKGLNDDYRNVLLSILEEMPKIPNSELVKGKNQSDEDFNKVVDERNSKWDSAIEDGKEQALKEHEYRKKSTEKQKEKKRAEKEKLKIHESESQEDKSQSQEKNTTPVLTRPRDEEENDVDDHQDENQESRKRIKTDE